MDQQPASAVASDPRRFPFPPGITIGALLISWGLQALWPLPVFWPHWVRWVGWVLFVTPPLLATWAMITFRRHGTVVDPLGDARQVVSAGPFRFTRNPMYLSLMINYVGGTLAFGLPWGIVLLVPVFLALHFGVILPEERYLEAKFGTEYAEYRRRVRRWV